MAVGSIITFSSLLGGTITGTKVMSVKQLTNMMISGQNDLVLQYLRSLPKDECNRTRARIVKNLEEIQKKRKNGTVSRRSGTTAATAASAVSPTSATSATSTSSTSSATTTANLSTTSTSSSTGGNHKNKLDGKEEGKHEKNGGGSVGKSSKRKKQRKRVPGEISEGGLSSTTDDDSKEMIGIYRVEDELGRGMFGVVYKGTNTQNGLPVAIKQIDLTAIDKTKLPVVMREAEVMDSLAHQNIVEIYGVIQSPDKKIISFILEYVDCGSLFKLLKFYGTFPQDISSICVRQCLEGLVYLHSKNIVHRDIKCDNLLINSNGIIKLADFGTAKTDDQSKNFTVVGTPFWMAPEVIEMTGGGTISDIWSLGCTLLELLMGEPPYFKFGTMQALFSIVEDDHPPVPDSFLQDKDLNHFLLVCCFQKNPKLRTPSSELLKQEWITKHKNLPIPTFAELSTILSEHNKSQGTSPSEGSSSVTLRKRSPNLLSIPQNASPEELELFLEELIKERDGIKSENVKLRKLIESSFR
eukprot:TRINITY_DN3260_c0_g3_i1.p1 TRINITY_DN3260_c0_g3~~TRINITY_DN3260_c0_g3_i1.p1  ORF type:complete len:526 (+),score=112.53 TRINITY_DN3260_c0_g3_i1:225-1802(+)